MFFFAIAALAVGLPVLFACVVLASRRKSRYFAFPLVLGLISGGIVSLMPQPLGAPVAFMVGFTIVGVPAAAVCAFVGLIGKADKRWPNGVRDGFAAVFMIASVWLGFNELDRPGGEPTGQFVGTVRNSSGHVGRDGVIENRMDIALDDGRRVNATARHPVVAMPEPFPPPRVPERLEPERVRVNEYRSFISGRTSYTVVGSEPVR